MKKFFKVVTVILLAINSWAQAPQSFSYQAVVRGAKNELLVNKPVGMKISLLQGSEKGKAVYVETHKPTSDDNGLVSIAIGGGTKEASSIAFASIDWSKGPYFVQTETDPTGGDNFTIISISQLLSVPYAIHAKTAESIVGSNLGNNSGSFGHYIGEEFGGGVIFYLWKDKLGAEHGLVVATSDQSTSHVWSNVANVVIGDAASSSWDGFSNSNAIVNQPGHTSSAAKICFDLVSGGQSDWYLPTIQELNMLSNNYLAVNRSLFQISGATQLGSSPYWSSSETNTSSWYFLFFNGIASNDVNNKSRTYYVRAVRAF